MTFFTAAHAGRAPLPLALLAAAGVLAALLALMVPLTNEAAGALMSSEVLLG